MPRLREILKHPWRCTISALWIFFASVRSRRPAQHCRDGQSYEWFDDLDMRDGDKEMMQEQREETQESQKRKRTSPQPPFHCVEAAFAHNQDGQAEESVPDVKKQRQDDDGGDFYPAPLTHDHFELVLQVMQIDVLYWPSDGLFLSRAAALLLGVAAIASKTSANVLL